MPELFSSRQGSTRLEKRDKWAVLLLTLVYTVFTLLNLGTLSFPQSVWTAEAGESVTLDLGETRTVSKLIFNGNIAEGRLLVAADDGGTYEYSQVYGEMFSWREKNVSFSTRYLYLTVLSGTVSLNELALRDTDGMLLPVTISEGDAASLFDEQDTVPEKPSCLNGMYFDEIYHARTAYEFLHGMNVYEWTHPPLGKAIIALGVTIFGMCPFGWRVMPALFGAMMLPLMYLLGKRLLRRSDLAFLGAALFALDTMHFAQTRIATVDVFIVFFILLMAVFMTDYLQTDFVRTPLRKQLIPLGACGLSFGFGVASKWTGLYAGVGLALLFFGHLISAGVKINSDDKEKRLYWSRFWKTILFCCLFFVAIPAIIYYLSYIPFYRYEASRSAGDYGFRESVHTLLIQQQSMFSYHSNLTATHLCQSSWFQWPFMERSVWFYSGHDALTDRFSEIITIGSPAVCWISAVGMLALITESVFGGWEKYTGERKRSIVILLVFAAANLLPWVTVPRCTFAYHFFPTLPFMLLSAVLLIDHLEADGTLSRKLKWAWLALAAVYFLLMYPGISGLPMSRSYAYFLEHILPGGYLFYGTV